MMISPTGQKVSVGDNLINEFLSRGFTLSDFVELASRKGNIVRVKKDQVGKYIDKGFTKPNEENWGRLIYNGVEQGLLNVVDLPQNLVALAELGAKEVQYVLEGLDLPTNTDWTLQTKPLSKSIKETVKEKLGYEPAAYSPRTTMGKIASGTITGATELPLGGYWGNFAKVANKLTMRALINEYGTLNADLSNLVQNLEEYKAAEAAEAAEEARYNKPVQPNGAAPIAEAPQDINNQIKNTIPNVTMDENGNVTDEFGNIIE